MKIFVSHASKDNQIVKKIVDILRKYYNEDEIWVDYNQIEPLDSDAISKINKGLKTSTFFLLIWSKDAENSEWVEKEVNAASSSDYGHIKKFSFRLDNTRLPPLDFSTGRYDRITKSNVTDKTTKFAYSLGGSFRTQIRIYKERVVEDFKNFKKGEKYQPIIKEFKKYDAYRLLISQKYEDIIKLKPSETDGRSGIESTEKSDILTEVMTTLENDDKNKMIPVVGDYGSGKSYLSRYVLFKLCQEIDDSVIPVYIPLGSIDYDHPVEKTENIGDGLLFSIYNYIKREYGIIDKDIFFDHVNNGRLIFLLDAFDELDRTIDDKIIEDNINAIEIIIKKGNKVLLTCRSNYLSKNNELRLIEGYGIRQIKDFDEKQINEFIDKNYKINLDYERKEKILNLVKSVELGEFAKKPLLLQIIYDNYRQFEKKSIANAATIFKILTEKWIIFDVNKRRDLTLKEKTELQNHRQRISEVLAIHANENGINSISKKDIFDKVREEFASDPEIVKGYLDGYYHDAKNSTFLIKEQNKEDDEYFSFIYSSIMEYLVARRIVTLINEGNTAELLKYSEQIESAEIFTFIDYITDIEWTVRPHANLNSKKKKTSPNLDRSDYLYRIIEEAGDKRPSLKLGKLVSILYLVSDFGKHNFRAKTKSSNSKLIDFSNCDLEGAILPNAFLPNVILSNANLSRSNLEGANLEGANLTRANLTRAKLIRANLEDAKLTNSILNDCDFHLANLTRAKLIGANVLMTKLSHANLEDADLSNIHTDPKEYRETESPYDVDISLSTLTRVNLNDAVIPNCIILNPGSYVGLTGNSKTNLENLITDDTNFIALIGIFTTSIPTSIPDKKTLKKRLEMRTCEWPSNDYYERISRLS